MGLSNGKPNVIIEISYCGGCGWTKTAQKLCQAIKTQLPEAIIDCKPEDKYTGLLEASIIVDKVKHKKIYSGNK